eukprot:gene3890-4250_t
MCCIISGDPIEDERGRIKTFSGPQTFQTSAMNAPCAGGCTTILWFCGQFIPFTCGITQYCLRRKVLNGDMSKYSCFQGQLNPCCCQAGSCGENNCPDLCLCLEAHCCNSCAISASRMYVMEKYDLSSDPCDYRLIRINNCLQILSCICNIIAIFVQDIRECARIIDRIADIFYHCVSGCFTAQVAYEVDYQNSIGNRGLVQQGVLVTAEPVEYAKA